MNFRLIDTGFNSAFMNMAIDEALLTSKLPVLRFYQWKPAGLSIGYFQSIKNFNFKNLKKHKIDLVRRLTGGNAVLHDKELTYSFIIDESEMPKSIIESYKIISKGLLQGLKNLDLKAEMNKDVKQEEKSAVCFNEPSWYEILINNKKIIGSAQKRVKGKLLQHGAILIDIDVEKYASLFDNCDEELIKKLKQRMTSINNELKKKSSHGADEPGDAPETKSSGVPEIARQFLSTPSGVARRTFHEVKCPSAAMDGWIFSKNYKKVKQAMIKGFEKALKVKFIEGELTKEELKLAKELYKAKYSTDKWNLMR